MVFDFFGSDHACATDLLHCTRCRVISAPARRRLKWRRSPPLRHGRAHAFDRSHWRRRRRCARRPQRSSAPGTFWCRRRLRRRIFRDPSQSPILCNDGVTIAKEFDLKDPEENLDVQVCFTRSRTSKLDALPNSPLRFGTLGIEPFRRCSMPNWANPRRHLAMRRDARLCRIAWRIGTSGAA